MHKANAPISATREATALNGVDEARLAARLMIHLLVAGPSIVRSLDNPDDTTPPLLESLQALTKRVTDSAVEDVRGLLDVALEGLEREVSAENLRRLLERADDALAALQGWMTLAANARTCLEHPELRGGVG